MAEFFAGEARTSSSCVPFIRRTGRTQAKRGSLAKARICAGSLGVNAWPGMGLPALQSRSVDVSDLDVLGHGLAIFEDDHLSSPFWKITSSFFGNTNKAAVSASAAFLRLLSWLGSARVRTRPWCNWRRGKGPSQTNTRRALGSKRSCKPRCGDHRPSQPRAGLETASNAVLSGGNNQVNALSLNACPYRATEIPHRRPLIVKVIGTTTILTRAVETASHWSLNSTRSSSISCTPASSNACPEMSLSL